MAAKSEGLIPPDNEMLIDYDDKASPHLNVLSTQPLTHSPIPSLPSWDLGSSGLYDPNRMNLFNLGEGMAIRDVPEEGFIFGQRVIDLNEWAEYAANS